MESMTLLDNYRQRLRSNIEQLHASGKVVVYKGYQREIFSGTGLDLYLNPTDADGNIDPLSIESNKRAVYKELISPAAPFLILFEQLAFAIENSSFDPINENLVIVEDNLRALFPYAVAAPLAVDGEIDGEQVLTPPLNSYAQVITIGEKQYTTYVSSPEQVRSQSLFSDSVEPERVYQKDHPSLVDIETDTTSIDLLINESLLTSNVPAVCVELSQCDPMFPLLAERLAILNGCFQEAGGHLCFYSGQVTVQSAQSGIRLMELLQRYWGPSASFRPINFYSRPEVSKATHQVGQDVIVDHILAQCDNASKKRDYRDIFITAPTGAGKSLLFQLPAFHLSELGQVTVVVSPLIALMKDQVQAIMRDRNYSKVAYLNSELSLVDRERIIEHVKQGDIDVLYLSPELLLSYDISHFLGERKLGLVIIDEAHLVTTWGRDFRVDYWFLGNHLRKTRKYSGHDFVIMACTATAVFGGANDMVFDCMDSLYLKSPIYFIGSVTRDDIHFVIGREESPEKGFDAFKIKQTTQLCKDVLAKTNLKALVYAPYVKQITQIQDGLDADEKGQVSLYYGSLDMASKNHYFDEYLDGRRRLMLATKAFGMGIDIKDIEVVYHHAPSGQLADYVQEIGRIARDPSLEGYALINFSARDVRYMNVLHGISSIKPWELRGVLDKLAKVYQRERAKNLLFSVDDFANIFPDVLDLGQKVMTALMMIERDYLIKSRFNVIIARPKKLFTRVFARIERDLLSTFLREYRATCTEIPYQTGGPDNAYAFIEIDLDHLWRLRFRDISFPMLKAKFYNRTLFGAQATAVVPQLKFTFKLTGEFDHAMKQFQRFLSLVFEFFSSSNSYFKEEDLAAYLRRNGYDEARAKSISQRLLAMYGSHRESSQKLYDPNAFLQRRHSAEPGVAEYTVFRNMHQAEHQQLLRLVQKIFDQAGEKYVRYAGKDEGFDGRLMRLGYLMEMAEAGLFETVGGEAPMVFVRLNDPRKVLYDARNPHYSNILLADVHRRHHVSVDIFKHFFLRDMPDETRWNFVEDYFLGKDTEELLELYPGEAPGSPNDIVALLPSSESSGSESNRGPANNVPVFFPPTTGRNYTGKDLLTLQGSKGSETKTVSQWIKDAPVDLALARDENKLSLDYESFTVLESIVTQDANYMKRKKGFEHKTSLVPGGIVKPARSHFL
ncbi:MAG TPA: helicase-related protein, partial [Flavobacteriales bacterium]|nr:helicase-related protein [Flavobacteriales bacterium]